MHDLLHTELTNQAVLPPGGDKRIAAFSQAILKMVGTPELDTILQMMLTYRTSVSPSYAVNLLLRAFQKQLLVHDSHFPDDFTSVSVWMTAIRALLDDTGIKAALYRDVLQRETQSNVVERYKAFKLVIGLLQSQLGDGLSVLDVGCSRNHGLKKLKLNLPFKPVSCGVKDSDRLPHALLDSLFNGVLRQPLSLGRCQGSDIVPLAATDGRDWAKSCSFYPSELLNAAAVSEYDYLDSSDIAGVNFAIGDFKAAGMGLHTYAQKYDVITVSTFLYQLSADERVDARRLFKQYLRPGGIIIYQDFVRPSADGQSLEFETNWFDSLFPYRTLLEFGNDITGQLYEVLRWDNGRCNRWVPGNDMSALLKDQYLFT